MFKEERETSLFEWGMIGDIGLGRPNLGSEMDVSVYRLMQFTLRDVLIQKYGVAEADAIFYEAGKEAGDAFFENLLTQKDSFDSFVSDIQEKFKALGIGVFRVEKMDLEELKFTITVSEDLDCSGLPVTDEEICTYDEGFINGVLSSYTGIDFTVKEVDCWCSGDRVCRFIADGDKSSQYEK